MDGQLLDQIFVGSGASLANLIIHALLLGVVLWAVKYLSLRDTFVPGFVQYNLIIVAVGTLLVAVHFVEVLVWANIYAFVDGAPEGTDLVYLAFGNYTTLGFKTGTQLLEQWHLLAPMTALNGIMLIGWSTALIIDILRRTGHMVEKAAQANGDGAATDTTT
jgi:hypothetical protein